MFTKLIAAGVLSAMCVVAAAAPSVYQFNQGGFALDAAVSGVFRGEDVNGDGEIVFTDGEVDFFAAAFSGNALVPSFTMTTAGLVELVFELDGGTLLGDGVALRQEGIFWDTLLGRSWLVGPGAFSAGPCDAVSIVCGTVAAGLGDDFSRHLVTVRPASASVPEPSVLALPFIAACALWLVRRAS